MIGCPEISEYIMYDNTCKICQGYKSDTWQSKMYNLMQLCCLFHYTFVFQDIPIFFFSSSRRKYLCQDKDESCCSLLIFICIVVIVLNFIAFIVLSVIIKSMKDFGVKDWNSFDLTGLIFYHVLCLHLSRKV